MSSGRNYSDVGQTPIDGGNTRPSERIYGSDCGLRATDVATSAMPGESIYGADVGQKATQGYHQDAKDRASKGFQEMQSDETRGLDESRYEPLKGHNEATAESHSITERLRDQASHLFHSAKEYATGAVDTVKDKFSHGHHNDDELKDTSIHSSTSIENRNNSGTESRLPQGESHNVGDRLYGQASDLYDSAKDTLKKQFNSGSEQQNTIDSSHPSSFGQSNRSSDTGIQQSNIYGTQRTGDSGIHSTNTYDSTSYISDNHRDSPSVTEKIRDKTSDMYHSAKDTVQEKWEAGKDYMSGNSNKDASNPSGRPGDSAYSTGMTGSGFDHVDSSYRHGAGRDLPSEKFSQSGLKHRDDITLSGQRNTEETTRGG